MKQSNNQIGKIFNKVLGQHPSTITFEGVWDKLSNRSRGKASLRKLRVIPLTIIITVLALCTMGFAYNIMRNIDNTDYPFVDDQRVIGKWESVDLIKNIDDFKPGSTHVDRELYLKSYVFIKGGNMLGALDSYNLAYVPTTWTKDLVLNKQEKTASKYEIKEIDGNTYMFFQWKTGDYIFQNMTPSYYVLKKADSEDYSNYEIQRLKVDNIDYPFVDDQQVLGKWETVDFVKTLDNFKAGEKNWRDDLYLKNLKFEDSGNMSTTTEKGNYSGMSWTKGLVLSQGDLTASKYEIKNIDGTDYMFFEWKNGDYVYRNMKPSYYVLRRTD